MVSPPTDRLLRIREVRRTVIAGMRPGTADDPAFIMKRVWIFLVGPRRVLVVRERALAPLPTLGGAPWCGLVRSSRVCSSATSSDGGRYCIAIALLTTVTDNVSHRRCC